jgi:zinc transport system substrate-binding protein
MEWNGNNMRRKSVIIILIMLLIVSASTLITVLTRQKSGENNKITIVTSFYPMYILTANITRHIPGVEVINLTEPTSGCLHDYQLTTSDMKKLENADMLIINGGGMENFTGNILKTYPDLPVVNASEGIKYLKGEGHHHEEDNKEHNSEEYNAHVWLNMDYYIKQIQTIQEALSKYDVKNAKKYQDNGNAYQSKILSLKNDMESALKGAENTKVIIFHDSFAYLAEELGFNVVHAVDMDSESSLSAGEIAEVVDEVKENQIRILFTEEQFSTSVADNIAEETGAKVYILDSIVRGEMSEDGYINAMHKNIEVLKKAFQTEAK